MAANNLSYQFKTANIVIKLIAINVVVYIGVLLLSWIFRFSQDYMMQWFVLPGQLGDFILQPWSLLTYAFLHFDFWHIFWNMLVMYWFGNIVLNLFTEKRFLTVYLLGAMAGGLLFMIGYNLFPVLINSRAFLLGASGAITAIMIFIATYTPNTEVRIIFFNVKLWQIGLFVVLVDLIQIPESNNAGGLLAHLGGAIFGYVYAQQLAKGNDIGLWWERTIDSLVAYFKRKPKSASMKTVYRKKKEPSVTSSVRNNTLSKTEQQHKIDNILDKISKSGYESLSKQEKDFLFKAGKDN
tara:strand:- start:188 stop:1075 length:888 start_codon:yes stop_codon:yes gene_type:complete